MAITPVAQRVKAFRFAVAFDRPALAGQHVELRLTAPDGYQAQRSYSIASAPDDSGTIELVIESVGDGEVSVFFDTVAAVGDLQDGGGVLISVLAHPTTGGVTASFASLGDVILAEPGALTSFAGPRVVAQTTREKLPDDFGLAESNFRFGHVDAVVQRNDLRTTLARLLRLFGAER